jgi:hypothetical protein
MGFIRSFHSPTRGDIKSPTDLLTMTPCHVDNLNLSTIKLLITSTTINLSTTLDITIYSTRGDLSYSKSFLLDRVGIVGYMGGGPLPSSNPDSLPPPSRVLYRGIMLEIIRTLFKKFFYYFFSENWGFISPTNLYRNSPSYYDDSPLICVEIPHPYYGRVVGVKTFHSGNR